jgi:lysyl endopeptidase
MKRLLFLAFTATWGVFCAQAQLSVPGTPPSFLTKSLSADLPAVTMPALDMAAVAQEDERDEAAGLPPRFGYPHEVKYSLENAGIWEEYPGGGRVWRLQVNAPEALSINFCYSDWFMPTGAEFYVYSLNRRHVIGAFTEQNNKQDGVFATGLVYGDAVVLEYYEPESVRGLGSMTISRIVHGYRYISGLVDPDLIEEAFGGSGGCQVNVNCSPEGDNWQDEKRGVAMILSSGFRLCTGSLINTTRNDCTPYFLTAHHCRDGFDAVSNPNMNTWSFYWMYESPGCADGSDFLPPSTNGAVMRANDSPSDFALLQLNEDPASIPGLDPYYNGWDATTSPGAGGVGIHHPAGDIKKIATHSSVPALDNWFSGIPNTHWSLFWDATPNGYSVTEGGSSGSPLFSNNSRILGQLHGGSSINCSNPSADIGKYGRMAYSLNNVGATDNRRKLSPWLDPDGLGVTFVDGSYGSCSSGCLAPSGLSASSITTSGAVLSWNPVSEASSYNGRYRAVGAPSWINFSTASTSFSISSLAECTQYEFQVASVCDAGLSSFFTLSFLFKSEGCPCPDYCVSGGSTVDEFIQSVTIGDLVNNSGDNGGYVNFTGTSFTANYLPGTSYSVTLTPGYNGTVYPEYFHIYIDYNQDGDFDDAGELAFDPGTTVSSTSATGTLTIPASAPLGSTGLRVVMRYSSAPTPCGTFTWAETEDYCVTIGESASCSTSSAPANPATFNGPTSATLTWIPVPGSVGCQVQATRISPAGPTRTREILGSEVFSTTVPYSILGSGSTWQWQVRCACSIDPLSVTPFSSTSLINVPVLREGLATAPQLNLYPNPADQFLVLEWESAWDSEATIRLIDLLGRTVLEQRAAVWNGTNRLELSTADLPSGSYRLQITDQSGVSAIPVQIEHAGR